MKYELEDMVQRDHNYCIVDEVDSILIDESRTPLIISGKLEDKTTLYNTTNEFIKHLQKNDYELDEKNKNVILTDLGTDKIEKLASQKRVLKNNNFYDPENLNLVHHVNQALKANLLYNKDTDYIVRDGKVQIIDEFTGRVLGGRRFSDGLHQAIEAKENVKVEEENQTLASITYQNYFRLYKKLSGMTGTAMTEAEEFFDIYKLPVVSIPTNKEMLRKDFNDQIYRTEKEKYNAITNKIIECNKKGQPVLVGTTSIEKSEKISDFFDSSFVEIFKFLGKPIIYPKGPAQKPTKKLLGKLISTGIKKLLKYLDQVTGEKFVQDFIEAVSILYQNKAPFLEALELEKQLRTFEFCNWFLVTSVEQSKLQEAAEFQSHTETFHKSNFFFLINKSLENHIKEWDIPSKGSSLGKESREKLASLKESMISKEEKTIKFAKTQFSQFIIFPEIIDANPVKHVGDLSKTWKNN